MPRESLAQLKLGDLATRRGLKLPDKEHRVDVRLLGQYAEVRERFGSKEPASHTEVRRWMNGDADKEGLPCGKTFANDLARRCGYETGEEMLSNCVLDHVFPQADMPKSFAGRLANLCVLETGFNLSAEFKVRGLEKTAFFGSNTITSNRQWLVYQIEQPFAHSLSFFQSASNRCGYYTLPVYASSGITRGGVSKPLPPANGETDEPTAAAVAASTEHCGSADKLAPATPATAPTAAAAVGRASGSRVRRRPKKDESQCCASAASTLREGA